MIRVYLSEHMAARLAAAAKRSGDTKSALVEAALDRFLGSDDDTDGNVTLARSLTGLSRQIEQIDRDLRIVNETVALHARFHLAVAPSVPAERLHAACKRGSTRFEEFAAQVGRRIRLRTPLVQETMDRLNTTSPTVSERERGDGWQLETRSSTCEPSLGGSTRVDDVTEHAAAVREDGSNENFPEQRSSLLH